jgi:hypothetical protein
LRLDSAPSDSAGGDRFGAIAGKGLGKNCRLSSAPYLWREFGERQSSLRETTGLPMASFQYTIVTP